MAAIDHRARPVELPGGVQLQEQLSVQGVPDAGPLPFAQAAPQVTPEP